MSNPRKTFADEFSQRLRFTPVVQEHLSLLDKEIFSDDLVMQYVYTREFAITRHTHLVQQWQDLGYGLYTLFSKETDEVVGRAGIFWAKQPEGFELGYTIARKFWRQGYAQEACKYLLDTVAPRIEASRIQAIIRPENEASILLAEKLGFVSDGTVIWEGHKERYFVWHAHV